jgi:hypothetical protein
VIVRNEQIAAMQEAANLTFERTLSKQLSAEAPDRLSQTPPAELRAFVHGAIVRARRHGISAPADLADFCALLVQIGGPSPRTGEPKWLRRILTDTKMDGSAKVQEIRTRAQSPKAAGGAA